MKKYVRTKDGIGRYDVDWNGASCVCLNHKWYWLVDIQIDILKQADTIEELCDKWIIVENGKPTVLAYECDLLDKIDNNKKLGIETTGYGAIWVIGDNEEPILKSVAKFNSKGDLELL